MIRSTLLLRRRLRITPFRRYVSSASSTVAWSVHPETGVVSHDKKPLFQTVIGMEIHAQLDIPTKLFSSAPRVAAAKPNTAVWPLDVAVPGMLPKLSKQALHQAILTAAACNCCISQTSRFERKHYAYADLPLGYQVTQQRWPIARNGSLTCTRQSKKKDSSLQQQFTVGIDRIQLEQDTGKTIAATKRESSPDGSTEYSVTESWIDFNRAGCALVEIVFYPDVRSAQDAATVVATLRDLLKYIGTCDGRMEEGSLRCDLNVSIAPLDDDTDDTTMDDDDDDDGDNPFQDSLPPGTGHRVEVKNLNSIKQVSIATQYEALRQGKCRMEGSPTNRQTRTLDVKTNQTVEIRTKEGAVDYRFLPEPDLPPIVLSREVLEGMTLDEFLSAKLPELPQEAAARLMEQYGISQDVALVITGDPPAVKLYEEAVRVAMDQSPVQNKKGVAATVANWLCNDVFALVNEAAATTTQQEPTVEISTVSARQLGELVAMILEDTISTTMAKKILAVMYHDDSIGKSPREIADERGWKLIADLEQLRDICLEVINQHSSQLEQYKKGGKHVRKITKFLAGKCMAHSGGNASPELLQDVLQQVLEELAPDVKP